jgi:hypothetical protein
MITFRPMPSLAAPARAIVVPLLFSFALSAPARAQSTLSHLEDAAPIPAGMIRLRIANVWTRFDERFAADGTSPLGAGLSTDSLGSAQLPRLLPVESGLRTLAGDPSLRLSLGRLQVASNARIVTTPIAFELGVTRRLSVGILVPVVQTRRVAQAVVTGDAAWANVGYVARESRRSAADRNAAVAAAFQQAADTLGRLLSNCPANPTAAGCASVNANSADATAARAQALAFAAGARALGATEAAALIAPRASSDLAGILETRRIQLNQRLQQYLGAGAGASQSVFFAPTDFSYIDLQGRGGVPALLGGPLGGGLDSIRTTEKLGFGDVAIGARFLVFDRFQYDSAPPPRLQSRLMVGGAVRLPTSRADSALSLVDIPTGEGAGVELNTAWDAIVGRLGATVGARYVKSFARTVQASVVGDPEADFPYPLFAARARTAGDVLGLDVTPRLLLTESIALNAHYGLERVGATSYGDPELSPLDPCANCLSIAPLPVVTVSGATRTAQRLGFGFRYSTVESYARGRARYPIEVSFVRLATVTGDPGVAKQTRDQLQLRVFYRLLRRR